MQQFYDIHNHYMPKVDDGSKSDEMTIQMLKTAYKEGIRGIILTPHYREPYFTTSREVVEQQYQKVCQLAKQVSLELEIFVGNEIHYHPEVLSWIQTGKVLTMAQSHYALIEFSTNESYETIHKCVTTLIAASYRPIIAHVERCTELLGHKDRIQELIDIGAYIQVNAGTFSGECGLKAKLFVKSLVKEELIDFVGTDAHNMSDRKPCINKCASYLKKVHGEKYMKRILYENPECIIQDEEL